MVKMFIISFIYWAEDLQGALAKKVIPLLKADVRFASFEPLITSAETSYDSWKAAGAQASKGDREKIELKNKHRKECMSKLRKLAMELDIFINGDRELAIATGLPMVATKEGVQFLPKPELEDLTHWGNSGGILAVWEPIRGALMYEVQYSLDGTATWEQWSLTPRHREKLTDLPLGVKVYVRVRAIGSNTKSDFSAEKYIFVS